ncbi:hypothetical protein ACE1TH_18745 [Shouchella sp. JSM 1781072]|uniref:hypothetical protein n=1 Tax=Bacillaceae TaxID=186817 RepID=UPI000C0720E3|nr:MULTISPECIES: hypothetical protein [Bacillaceae]UTR07568.1 hypothetical protein MM326_05940 [Alkalihalobacillus sp. LMS6]
MDVINYSILSVTGVGVVFAMFMSTLFFTPLLITVPLFAGWLGLVYTYKKGTHRNFYVIWGLSACILVVTVFLAVTFSLILMNG